MQLSGGTGGVAHAPIRYESPTPFVRPEYQRTLTPVSVSGRQARDEPTQGGDTLRGNSGIARRSFGLAFGLLALGLAVYMVARPPGAGWLPAAWRFPLAGVASASGLLGSAPSFLHACAFSLLTAVVSDARRPAVICGAWLAVNAIFELGQHPSISPALVAALPAWFAQVPLLDRIGAFFGGGSFDWNDIAAAALGAAAAWCWLATPTGGGSARKPEHSI